MRESIADYTTFGIGGPARRIAVVNSLGALTDELSKSGYIVLGGGSNVLVSDDGYDGTVVINRYAGVDVCGETVTVGSGARLSQIANRMACEELSGLEFAVGIPGSVGGAVRMNAGAFGGSISDVIVCADVLRDGRIVCMANSELRFSYRHSALMPNDTVLSATFALCRDSAAAIQARMRDFALRRRQTQPTGKSAGSVFKNPTGVSVARLIDEAGFKGYTVGGAQVSTKHANVIINTGGAKAKDVVTIINTIKNELSVRRGVFVEEEIIYIGEF